MRPNNVHLIRGTLFCLSPETGSVVKEVVAELPLSKGWLVAGVGASHPDNQNLFRADCLKIPILATATVVSVTTLLELFEFSRVATRKVLEKGKACE